MVSLAAILPFSDWESIATTPDALSLRPLTVVFGSEFVVVLLLARAGSEMDRRAAARVAQENARLRQLTEIAFEGILVHRNGRILDANRAFCVLVGLDLAAVRTHALADFAPAYRYRRDGPPLELELLTADGATVPIETLSRDIALSDGEAEVTAVRDIRERRAAEQSARDRQQVQDLRREAEELRERRRIAEEASRAKSAFLAMMSHEIRTPLNAVLGLAASLLDDALPSDHREVVMAIRDSGDALLRILNDVLDFSRLDAGRMSFETAPFSPGTLTQETLSVHGPHASAKAVAMRVDSDPDLPAVLLGDAGRHPPGAAQPGLQRGEIHRGRRDRRRGPLHRAHRGCGQHRMDRQRHRASASRNGTPWHVVRRVRAGGQLHHAAIRRFRASAWRSAGRSSSCMGGSIGVNPGWDRAAGSVSA